MPSAPLGRGPLDTRHLVSYDFWIASLGFLGPLVILGFRWHEMSFCFHALCASGCSRVITPTYDAVLVCFRFSYCSTCWCFIRSGVESEPSYGGCYDFYDGRWLALVLVTSMVLVV
jgi:hypothetical protein